MQINIGDKIGMLTIIERVESSAHGDKMFRCRCDCGREIIRKSGVISNTVNRGYMNSCGCNQNNRIRANKSKLASQHKSEAALKNREKTIERFKKLHDIADGTCYRRLENPNPRCDNHLGIKNISLINGSYQVQIMVQGTKFRKTCKNFEDAIRFKEEVYSNIVNPLIENHKLSIDNPTD